MPKENNNNVVWKYFKHGDIVKDTDDSIWENKLFEINYFHGNDYLPLVSAYLFGKNRSLRYLCNFDIRDLKLVSARKRPFIKINKSSLIKLMRRGNEEAKREMLMRINSKN